MNEMFVKAAMLIMMNMVEYCLLNLFLKNYFVSRYKALPKCLFGIVFVAVLTIVNFQQNFIKNIITGVCLVFASALIIYIGSIPKKFAFTIIFVAISSMSENLITFITSFAGVISISNAVGSFPTYSFAGFGGKISLFLLVRYLYRKYPKYYDLDKERDIMMLALFPTAALISTYVILGFNSKISISQWMHLMTIALLIIFIFLSVTIFFIYHSALHKEHLEHELKLNAEIKLTSEKLFLQQIESIKAMGAIQHEYKRHMDNILGYISQKKYMELTEYINGTLEDTSRHKLLVFIDFDNFVLNFLYGRFLQRCDENGIKLTSNIQFKSFQLLSEVDANAIFGNIFDNAIEACKRVKIEKRQVCFSISCTNNFAVITLVNSKANEIFYLPNSNIPLSTRRDYLSEGYGIKNVQTAVDKYKGYLSLDYNEDEFTCIIRLEVQ